MNRSTINSAPLVTVHARSPLGTLRKLHPEKTWRAVRVGFGWNYQTEDGWDAYWVSCLAPRYDADDDTFRSRFFIYKPDRQPEEVFGL